MIISPETLEFLLDPKGENVLFDEYFLLLNDVEFLAA